MNSNEVTLRPSVVYTEWSYSRVPADDECELCSAGCWVQLHVEEVFDWQVIFHFFGNQC